MSERPTPERLAEIRAYLKDWIDSPFGSELLVEIRALTAERDAAIKRASELPGLTAALDEARWERNVAKGEQTAGSQALAEIERLRAELAESEEKRAFLVGLADARAQGVLALTAERDAVRGERDKLDASLRGTLRTFDWFAKGVAAELGYDGPEDPGLLSDHIRGLIAERDRLRESVERLSRENGIGESLAESAHMERDRAYAERDRLAAYIERVRDAEFHSGGDLGPVSKVLQEEP